MHKLYKKDNFSIHNGRNKNITDTELDISFHTYKCYAYYSSVIGFNISILYYEGHTISDIDYYDNMHGMKKKNEVFSK